MARSSIPDIASDPEKGILKVSAFHTVLFDFEIQDTFVLTCFLGLMIISLISSKRNSGWTWMMRLPFISSKILLMTV